MEAPRPHLVILADSADALRELFGISLLERLLRTVQRLGFRQATILSADPDSIAAHLAPPSWARADVNLKFARHAAIELTIGDVRQATDEAERILCVSAGFYYDARLLAALAEQPATTRLIDSLLPAREAPAALIESEWLKGRDPAAPLWVELSLGNVASCDAGQAPSYIVNMRKDVRPVFFPAPMAERMALAENVLRDAAQKGTLDFPAAVFDPPIQDPIVRWLSETRVTPNQISFFTAGLGLLVTILFLSGHLWWGFAIAFAVEIFDGVDGKLARIRVETTAAGDWEHVSDYFIELSWWVALAFHFHGHGLPSAFALVVLLVASNWLDQLARFLVKKKLARDIDDVSDFDRFIRCIGARRNINIWIFAGGLLLGDPAHAFVLMCGWTAVTAAMHALRASQLLHARTA